MGLLILDSPSTRLLFSNKPAVISMLDRFFQFKPTSKRFFFYWDYYGMVLVLRIYGFPFTFQRQPCIFLKIDPKENDRQVTPPKNGCDAMLAKHR